MNLVKNSIEAIDDRIADEPTEFKRSIGIHAYTDGEFLCIDVADTGIGISDLQLKRIFNAGFTTNKDGRGLGLHSIANFVIGTGGKIELISDGHGKGTTMRVMFRLSAIVVVRQDTQEINNRGGGVKAF